MNGLFKTQLRKKSPRGGKKKIGSPARGGKLYTDKKKKPAGEGLPGTLSSLKTTKKGGAEKAYKGAKRVKE